MISSPGRGKILTLGMLVVFGHGFVRHMLHALGHVSLLLDQTSFQRHLSDPSQSVPSNMAEEYERINVEEAANTFLGARAGGDPMEAAHKTCSCCGYVNPNMSHFCYLAKKDGQWSFARLHDAELMKVLNKEVEVNMAGTVSFQCFRCAGKHIHNNEEFFVNEHDYQKPSNQFKKAGIKTFDGRNASADDFSARQAIAKVARTLGDEAAQKVRITYDQLRDDRYRYGSDWVTQLSSQQLSFDMLDIQYLYGCCCGAMPLKSSSWFLLRNPNSKEFWICSQCGVKFNCSKCPMFFTVKTESERGMVFRSPTKLPSDIENEIRMLQKTHVVARLATDPDAVSTDDIIRAIAAVAEKASGRIEQYLPFVMMKAKDSVFEKYPHATLLCTDERLSLRGGGQLFSACQVGSGEDLPTIGIDAIREIVYLAASTMDLELLEKNSSLGKNERRYVTNLKVQSSNLLEILRKSRH